MVTASRSTAAPETGATAPTAEGSPLTVDAHSLDNGHKQATGHTGLSWKYSAPSPQQPHHAPPQCRHPRAPRAQTGHPDAGQANPPHPVVRPGQQRPPQHQGGPTGSPRGPRAQAPDPSPRATQGRPTNRPRTRTHPPKHPGPHPRTVRQHHLSPNHHQPGQAHRHHQKAAPGLQSQEATSYTGPRVPTQPPTKHIRSRTHSQPPPLSNGADQWEPKRVKFLQLVF